MLGRLAVLHLLCGNRSQIAILLGEGLAAIAHSGIIKLRSLNSVEHQIDPNEVAVPKEVAV